MCSTSTRNGANDALPLLLTELQGEVPEVYGRVRTPSGGWHLWIAPLRVGKHTSFLPGLDLQGARADGTGRGFAFIPPTVRRSKADGVMRPYTWTEAPSASPSGDTSGVRLAGLIVALAEAKKASAPAARNGTVLFQGPPYGRMRGILARLLATQNGERNNLLYWAAGRFADLVGAGEIDSDTATGLLADAAADLGLTAEDGEQSVLATIASGMREVSG